MTTEDKPTGRLSLHGLLDDISSAASASLTAIPEIAESETLRKAAERLQNSQKELYQSLKDAYPSAILDQAERERFSKAIIQARDRDEAAEEAARKAREDLRAIVVEAADFGVSEQYVGRLGGVSRQTVRSWRNEPILDEQ